MATRAPNELGYPGGLAPPNSRFTVYGLDGFGFGHIMDVGFDTSAVKPYEHDRASAG